MYSDSNHIVEVSNSRDSSTCMTTFPFPYCPSPFECSISDYILRIANKYKSKGVTIKICICPNIKQLTFNF